MKALIFSLLASIAGGSVLASPAAAQHAGHSAREPQQSPEAQADAKIKCEEEAERHRAMGHQVAAGACKPALQPEAAMDPSQMDHSQMNHGQSGSQDMQGMDHSSMDMDPDVEIPLLPPPPEAGSGPARAAVAIWGEEAMDEARRELVRETDGGTRFWFQGDRLEYRAREGGDGYLWDVQGYYGGDIDKFWFKSEGEGSFGEPIEGAEVQALWSRAIAPFFDFQAGVRQDLTGPERTHAVIGIQGLAPYQFEVDAAAFVSTRGDVTARIEGELDQRITQRLILQPRAEIALSAQDIPELGIGAGLDRIEAGLRLRYEFAREFAPYVGVSQEWRIGGSADFARAVGEDPSVTNYVVGVRFWF